LDSDIQDLAAVSLGEYSMAFVNEYICKADRTKFGIDAIDEDLRRCAQLRSLDWTIDHEREIYLRIINRGRDEFARRSKWHFFWHGELLTFWLELVDAGGERGGHGWAHYKIDRSAGDFVPSHLQADRGEIVADLRAALEAYKDGGVFSTIETNTTRLDA
jgi:hypothetical protein